MDKSDNQGKTGDRRKLFGFLLKLLAGLGGGALVYSGYRFSSPGEVSEDDYLPGGMVKKAGLAGSGIAGLVGKNPGSDSVSLNPGSIGPGQSRVLAVGYTPVIVINQGGEFKAFTATCTHLGCLVKWDPAAGQFVCPCHGGKYDKEGNPVAGPPPLPLRRCRVKTEKDKVVISL